MMKACRFLVPGLVPGLGLTVLFALGSPVSAQTLQELVDELEIRFDCPGAAFTSGGRFVDCGNGTVRDMNTGLIWLRDASCAELPGTNSEGAVETRPEAEASVRQLASGLCGLSDSSLPGQWRLPTIAELCSQAGLSSPVGTCPAADAIDSLVNVNFSSPALSNASGSGGWADGDPFVGVQLASYWSGSVPAGGSTWIIVLTDGGYTFYTPPPPPPPPPFPQIPRPKLHIWPVRGQ